MQLLTIITAIVFLSTAFSQETAAEHLEVGSVFFNYGEVQSAKNHFEAAHKLDPNNCEILTMLGGVETMHFHNHKKALEYLQKCKPNAEYLSTHEFFLGCALRETGAYSKAINAFNQSLNLFPRTQFYSVHEIRYQLGLTHRDMKNYSDAIASFTECIEKKPYDSRFYWARAETYLTMNQPDKSIADVNLGLQHYSNNLTKSNLYMVRGDAYRQKGDSTSACADYIEAIELGNIIAEFRASNCPDSPSFGKTLIKPSEQPVTSELNVNTKERTTLDPSQLSWEHLASETPEKEVVKKGSCMSGIIGCESIQKAIPASREGFKNDLGTIIHGEGTESVIYNSKIEFPDAKEAIIVEMVGFNIGLHITYMKETDPYNLDESYADLVDIVRGCIQLSGNVILEEAVSENDTTFRLKSKDHPENDAYLQAKHGVHITISKDGGELTLSL